MVIYRACKLSTSAACLRYRRGAALAWLFAAGGWRMRTAKRRGGWRRTSATVSRGHRGVLHMARGGILRRRMRLDRDGLWRRGLAASAAARKTRRHGGFASRDALSSRDIIAALAPFASRRASNHYASATELINDNALFALAYRAPAALAAGSGRVAAAAASRGSEKKKKSSRENGNAALAARQRCHRRGIAHAPPRAARQHRICISPPARITLPPGCITAIVRRGGSCLPSSSLARRWLQASPRAARCCGMPWRPGVAFSLSRGS